MPKRRLPHEHLGEQWIFEDTSDLAVKGEPIHKRVLLSYVNSSGGGLIFFRGRPLDKVRKVLAMPTLQVSWTQIHLPSKAVRKLSTVIGFPGQDVAAALPRGFEGFRRKVENQGRESV